MESEYQTLWDLPVGPDPAAAFRPVQRPPDRFAHNLSGSTERRALIQAHGDIGTKVFLDLHGPLRTELQQGPIDMRAKDGRPIVDAKIGGQAIDLEAAAIG